MCTEHSGAQTDVDHITEPDLLCGEATFGWVLKDDFFFNKCFYSEIILDSKEAVKIVQSSCVPFTQLPPMITSYISRACYQCQEADSGAIPITQLQALFAFHQGWWGLQVGGRETVEKGWRSSRLGSTCL